MKITNLCDISTSRGMSNNIQYIMDAIKHNYHNNNQLGTDTTVQWDNSANTYFFSVAYSL